ncbi:glycosyltransferase, MSMEG_0565 family [Jatrophihabitans endophyticus]|uniref:Glycosyltransferase, MSMEG_0565 family n=1 Tax=Jatrophihabitans endophyticus TaxID=1206085 RepID=A0A1M5TXQ7_9ACTN|nr:MSMEG_0565 family glycosyltransferase [Jatrophihabitans endophyticus]SHH55441.1 glycosyltransferase, MSMEG_0565 family [Jatrophihabitans endophyticus]
MRIALLTYSTRPRGGVVHTLALAEALVELGHDVDVWSLARGGDAGFFRPVDPAVGVRLVPFPEVEGESVGTRILRSIDVLGTAFAAVGHDYDVVHAQDCISANAAPRCVRTIHHLDTFTTPELAACHERAVVTPYAHVCVSHAVAAEVRAGWGIAATVIPNGVDAARFAGVAAADRDRRRAELGRYVLAVGGIEPRKGSADLVEAMAHARRRDPGLRLVVAGGETLFDYRDYRAAVLARAAALDVEPVLLGPVAHDALPSYVAGATAFAFPSVKEGFGMAALEAMAAGVPVVMRDLPVLREVFAGAATFAAGPHDLAAGLLAAARGPDAERVGRGRALAERHTWRAAASAHADLYAALCQPTAPHL